LQGIEDLVCFDTLLAQSAIVEHFDGLLEVGEREERLHAGSRAYAVAYVNENS
jgi:hypothetical protein